MIEHRTTNAEYNEAGVHIGWTHLTVRDHYGILNPEMTHQDMNELVALLTPFFRAPENVDPAEGQDPRRPLGMYIPQENLQEVNTLLDDNGFKIDAPNNARNIMAATVNMTTTMAPELNQCNVTINIIADYTRRM